LVVKEVLTLVQLSRFEMMQKTTKFSIMLRMPKLHFIHALKDETNETSRTVSSSSQEKDLVFYLSK
jgi:hypothetical protein